MVCLCRALCFLQGIVLVVGGVQEKRWVLRGIAPIDGEITRLATGISQNVF